MKELASPEPCLLPTNFQDGLEVHELSSEALLNKGSASKTRPLSSAGSAHRAAQYTYLQGSLCSALNTLMRARICDSAPLSSIGQDVLTSALRAAIRCTQPTMQTRLQGKSTKRLVCAAQACIHTYAAFLLQVAAQEFVRLQQSLCLEAAHDRARCQQLPKSSKMMTVWRQLDTHIQQLECLPSALKSWVEGALDDEHVADTTVRKSILVPISDVARKTQEGVFAAQQARLSMQS